MSWIEQYWLQVLFGFVLAGLGAAYRYISVRVKAVTKGVTALLRDRIVQAYNHYYVEMGYWPIYARDNVLSMYEEYRALDGNGTVSDLVDKLRKLPTQEEKTT